MRLIKIGEYSKVKEYSYLENYQEFKKVSPVSPGEPHFRNIMRYYVARGFYKNGLVDISIQAKFVDEITGRSFLFDVTAFDNNYNYLSLCFAESLREEDDAVLENFTELENGKLILVLSNLISTDNLKRKFNLCFEKGLFQIKTIVLPPFGDLYEYDIWMFETTFSDIKVDRK